MGSNTATLIVIIYTSLAAISTAAAEPTPSPLSEFVSSPENLTVLEGEPAVLRCKIRESVHTCQWYYLEKGLDFFDTRFTPLPIKTFRSINDQDCSIKFKSVRVRQTGQWMCKGFKIHARKYIISSPAILDVIPKDDTIDEHTTFPSTDMGESDDSDDNAPPDETDFLFSDDMEGHVLNSHLGYEVLLDCQAVVPLNKCAWITPDGIKFKREGPKPSNHNHIEIVGDMREGNCSLLTRVKYQDEGNWRCIVTAEDELSQRVGPLIHLHILELGPHLNDPKDQLIDEQTGASLVTILVVTLFVLLFIVVALCLYIYRQRKLRNDHTSFVSNPSSVDYNTYASSWLPPFGIKEQQLLHEQTLKSNDDTASNQYPRYLDMTGGAMPGREGYVMFPPSSIRSSTSSRTTLSTLPAGRHPSFGNNSGHTSISESLPSMSSVDELPFDKKPLGLTLSTYSTGHLYEEIKYGQKEDCDALKKSFAELDKEGYMLPKAPSQVHIMDKKQPLEDQTKTSGSMIPPYTKITQGGLVAADCNTNWASNPTYGIDSEKKNKEMNENYDTPINPPLPIRIDSAHENPLANYDIPSKTVTPIPSGEEDNISSS